MPISLVNLCYILNYEIQEINNLCYILNYVLFHHCFLMQAVLRQASGVFVLSVSNQTLIYILYSTRLSNLCCKKLKSRYME